MQAAQRGLVGAVLAGLVADCAGARDAPEGEVWLAGADTIIHRVP